MATKLFQDTMTTSPPPSPPPDNSPPHRSLRRSIEHIPRSRTPSPTHRLKAHRSVSAPADTHYFPPNTARASPTNSEDDEREGRLLREWTRGSAQLPPRTPSGSLKRTPCSKSKKRSMLRRSHSGDSHHSDNTHRNNLASLFQVSFPADDQLTQVTEFERVDSSLKQELWYFAKELKYLLAWEVERNRQYEEGELDLLDEQYAGLQEEDICCWRGLEHVWEGEDRSLRIRKTVTGIVHWHTDAKEMGYNDPDELRVVAKARTKSDRTKAQKRATHDASYIKKLQKHEIGEQLQHPTSPTFSSPKKMVKRLSGMLIAKTLPTLHWSPKPNKKAFF